MTPFCGLGHRPAAALSALRHIGNGTTSGTPPDGERTQVITIFRIPTRAVRGVGPHKGFQLSAARQNPRF
jgi:hypothetical protein